MRKKNTTPLKLNKETLLALEETLRQVAGGSQSCTCQYTTYTGGTDCCQ